MPKFKLISVLTPILFSSLLLMLSCSSKTDSGSSSDTTSATDTTALTEDERIELFMNEAMDRLRYKDKTVLYENEFAYYREKFSFDHYLTETRIQKAEADTLVNIDVKSVTYFDRDSAKVYLEVHYKGPTGKETVKKQNGVPIYWHEGKWIKPTLSNFIAQKEYDDIIEKAKSASESEKQGSGQ